MPKISFARRFKGYTIVELVMVMSVLAILAGLVLVNFPGVRITSEDIQRKNDLKQVSQALERYANSNNGLFPLQSAGEVGVSTICVTLGLTGSACLTDPKNGSSECDGNVCGYYYRSSADRTDYVLRAALAKPLNDDYWTICSNGISGESATLSSDGSCPL